jgi:hypothetical protein
MTWETLGPARLVQFPHPGSEYPKPRGPRAEWRRGKDDHRRTFLVSPGTYRSAPDGDDFDGDVAFWGEWEGAVDVVGDVDHVPGGPTWLGRPDPSASPPDFPDSPPQNTDPFVWGDAMRYTYCRQPTNGKLRGLGRGSVILFGSSVGHRFVLEAVMVVSRWVDHRCAADLRGVTDDAHMRATIEPMYGWGEGATHRLYVGATPSEPVNGMFSFVPCRPATGRDVGFARPVVNLEGWINHNLRQQARMEDRDADAMRKAWEEVVNVVSSQQLALATELRL